MRSLITASIVVFMMTGVVLAEPTTTPTKPTSAPGALTGLEGFKTTYADALAAAKAADKPMYLHFTTTWCGWCRKIEKDVYATEAGKKALADFVPATLDCTVSGDKASPPVKINMDLMQKYGMSGYPSLIILAPDGAVLESWAGYVPLDQFQAKLAQATKAFAEYKAFQKTVTVADKKDYAANVKAMTTYLKYKKWDSAAESAGLVKSLDPDNKQGNAATASYVMWRAAKSGGMAADKLAALMEDIKKLDPKNEKGALELAIFEQATSLAEDGKFKECLAILTDLTSKAAKLNDGQQVYYMIGNVQAQGEDFVAAKASFEKSLAADPNSPHAEQLKAIIKKAQEMIDKKNAK